jgi:hypothetical protein
MVFKVLPGKKCPRPDSECGCGLPKTGKQNVCIKYAKTAGEAQKNHMKLCLKYDAKCDKSQMLEVFK